jgi:phosphoribosylaminoimidazolecarboxamide formyltransferase/IMP cyclohydrolase
MASLPVGSRRRALLSVTDKTGIVELGTLLAGHGYELVASGGTAAALRQADVPVTSVSDLTGYPEVFGGRVKTLHPVIHGGILGPTAASFTETAALGIAPIDVVVVNLYRFADAVASGASDPEIVEKIDIGGPALLRAAAKNFARVTVLSDPDDYDAFAAQVVDNDGATTVDFRREMAALTFARVERYDSAIADWFSGDADWATITLRYGENPHQNASLELPAAAAGEGPLSALGLEQHGGKELSYNNLVDLVAAVKLSGDFAEPCCGILKHTNPCGFGLGEGTLGLERALKCDPVSAFGGVFCFNHTVDEETAAILAKRFLEIIIAPSFAPAALAKLTRKKNVRVLTVDQERFLAATRTRSRTWGALTLVQDEDEGFPELDSWQVVAGDEPDAATRTALEMVWKVCKHGKSNAIVLGDLTATLGLGFGQMSRVDSTELAVMKAGNQGLDLTGCVAASDGFFPFPDGVQKLAAAGARAIIAPGGSIRDDEVAAAAAELGVTLILTERRHFNH